MNSLEELIQPYMNDRAALGAALAILQDGEITYLGGFGTTCVEIYGSPVTSQTLFAYGSISKTICATLVMRLVERGLLELDRPVVDYLPDFQFSRLDYGGKVTIRHLLSHTSGLPMAGKYWGPRDPDSLRRFVYEQIPYYEFLAEPGTVHLYSNTVICIAGHVAEAATGKFYDDLVQAYVFDPLQMKRSTYDPIVALTYPMALPHKKGSDGEPRVYHRMTYNVSGNPSSFAYGSVSDLAHLAQVFLNRGKFDNQQFLTPTSIAEMHKLHASRHIEGHAHPIAHVNQGYGLGFTVGNYQGKRVTRHGGMNLSFNCFFDLFPDDRAGVILLTNYSQDEPLMELLVTLYDHALGFPPQGIVYLDQPVRISGSFDRHQLQRYAGAYLNIETSRLATITLVGKELVMKYQEKSSPLVQFGSHQFYAGITEKYRLTVAFITGPDEEISHTMIGGEPYFPVELDPDFHPQPHLWKGYEGVYKDPSNRNPADIFTIRLQDGILFVAEGDREVIGKAISDRCFLSEVGLIEFEDTQLEDVKILVWGKATRFYPLDESKFRNNDVVQYLIDIPSV